MLPVWPSAPRPWVSEVFDERFGRRGLELSLIMSFLVTSLHQSEFVRSLRACILEHGSASEVTSDSCLVARIQAPAPLQRRVVSQARCFAPETVNQDADGKK